MQSTLYGEETVVDEAVLEPWLGERTFADWKKQFDRDGYLIFEDVLTSDELANIRSALAPHLNENISGRNVFEGVKTNRIYSLLAKSPVFADLVTHPLALAFAESDLGASCLLSACLAINLHPGETMQPWHYDDSHLNVPRPRGSWGISTFWAIDETTSENGATEIIPGSHLWPETDIKDAVVPASFTKENEIKVGANDESRPDAITATLKAGSFMVTKGTLWHRGGANRSSAPRLIITPQYCPGWARQLENMLLAVPPEIAETLPKRARELIGYSLHPPFMGFVNGVHPQKLLK